MTKRIIVLLDLSESSKKLLALASAWAQKTDAQVLAVHQTFSAAPGMGDSEIRSQIGMQSKREALTRLALFVAEADTADVNVKLHVTTSNLEHELQQLSTAYLDDIIVVGIRSKNWLERLMTGDTAVKLANELRRIVIAIPDLPAGYDLSTLHVAVKPGITLNEEAFRSLLGTIPGTVPEVKLLSVLRPDDRPEPTEEYLRSVCRQFGMLADMNYDLVHATGSFAVIKLHMEQHQGLLVIQKGQRNLADIFRKYFVNDAIRHAQIPIAVLPI